MALQTNSPFRWFLKAEETATSSYNIMMSNSKNDTNQEDGSSAVTDNEGEEIMLREEEDYDSVSTDVDDSEISLEGDVDSTQSPRMRMQMVGMVVQVQQLSDAEEDGEDDDDDDYHPLTFLDQIWLWDNTKRFELLWLT